MEIFIFFGSYLGGIVSGILLSTLTVLLVNKYQATIRNVISKVENMSSKGYIIEEDDEARNRKRIMEANEKFGYDTKLEDMLNL